MSNFAPCTCGSRMSRLPMIRGLSRVLPACTVRFRRPPIDSTVSGIQGPSAATSGRRHRAARRSSVGRQQPSAVMSASLRRFERHFHGLVVAHLRAQHCVRQGPPSTEAARVSGPQPVALVIIRAASSICASRADGITPSALMVASSFRQTQRQRCELLTAGAPLVGCPAEDRRRLRQRSLRAAARHRRH